jgi:two-component system chemotaxis response regulator CheB
MVELVVMGASWGGLDAASVVLEGLPPGFRVPVVLAQHRSPNMRGGLLERALAARSALPVMEVDDKDALERGRVYVAPADYHLMVGPRGAVALSVDAPVGHARPSIDVLFESAADTYGVGLVAVLLTGATDEGTAGLRAVRERGGQTIVQDPSTAERSEMPAAAVEAGVADRVLPLDQIPAALVEACA